MDQPPGDRGKKRPHQQGREPENGEPDEQFDAGDADIIGGFQVFVQGIIENRPERGFVWHAEGFFREVDVEGGVGDLLLQVIHPPLVLFGFAPRTRASSRETSSTWGICPVRFIICCGAFLFPVFQSSSDWSDWVFRPPLL